MLGFAQHGHGFMEEPSRVGNLTKRVRFPLGESYQSAIDTTMLCNNRCKTSVAYYNKRSLLTYFRSSRWAGRCVDLGRAQSHVWGKAGCLSTDLGWGSAACGLAGCRLTLAAAVWLCSSCLSSSFWGQWATPGLSFSWPWQGTSRHPPVGRPQSSLCLHPTG